MFFKLKLLKKRKPWKSTWCYFLLSGRKIGIL